MQKVIIHQLLHGYHDGHRLLAGSLPLDNSAGKLIQVLSDLPGQGLAPPTAGYITAYPVPSLKMYAFAQTWLAPEMARPGCVWTHTLLVDFSDLSEINDISILKLFRKPLNTAPLLSYGEPVKWHHDNNESFVANTDDIVIPRILTALYSFPDSCIFVLSDEKLPVKEIAFKIWLKQWPRLRRNFRFCTWAPNPRSNNEFDLQFVSGSRNYGQHSSQRAIFINISTDQNESSFVDDMPIDTFEYNNDSLKSFLWRYGAECEDGRAAFKPLIFVWRALSSSPVDIELLVSALQDISPTLTLYSRSLKEILKYAFDNKISDLVSNFILCNINLILGLIQEDSQFLEMAASVTLKLAPEIIWTYLRSNENLEKQLAVAAIKQMPARDICHAVANDAELYGDIVKVNPVIASDPYIWNSPTPIPQITGWVLKEHAESATYALPAMFQSDNPLVPDIAFEIYGQSALRAAINKYDEEFRSSINERAKRWIFAARRHPELILIEMAEGNIRSLQLLVFISTFVDKKSSYITSDTDPWVKALDIAHPLNANLPFSFASYIMARALGGYSKNPGRLIQHTFDSLHSYLMVSSIEYDSWNMLEKLLPEPGFWDWWDRCKMLRLGVVNTFVQLAIPPPDFIRITASHDTYEMLLKALAEIPGGLLYLKNLVTWSEKSGDSNMKWVGKSARKIVKRAFK